MTRINMGVKPAELCDQHLIAEYRELPRVFSFTPKPLSGDFRLGKGHVLWCAQFPGTLADRYESIVDEMKHRGFNVNFPDPKGNGKRATAKQIAKARPVVIARIQERLRDMRTKPTWTKRRNPKWA